MRTSMKIWNNYPEDYVEYELKQIKERAALLTLGKVTIPEILITLNQINISADERRCFETQCNKLGWNFYIMNDLPTISIPVEKIKQYKIELKKLQMEEDFTND